MQTHERLLTFEHVSTHESLTDAAVLAHTVEKTAEAGERLALISLGFKVSKPYRLELKWQYGWVKGGWPSDGERFITRACIHTSSPAGRLSHRAHRARLRSD